jgi:hypothetical protein
MACWWSSAANTDHDERAPTYARAASGSTGKLFITISSGEGIGRCCALREDKNQFLINDNGR